jgi:hypothetical protein
MPARAGPAVHRRGAQGLHMITQRILFGSGSAPGIDGASDD